MKTEHVAELLLSENKSFTAKMLEEKIGCSNREARKYLENLSKYEKYETICTSRPLSVKVVGIKGRTTSFDKLWSSLLYAK